MENEEPRSALVMRQCSKYLSRAADIQHAVECNNFEELSFPDPVNNSNASNNKNGQQNSSPPAYHVVQPVMSKSCVIDWGNVVGLELAKQVWLKSFVLRSI